MKYRGLALVAFFSSVASASPVLVSSDLHPNPSFVPLRVRAQSQPGSVEQLGEVVILEGDDSLVTADAMGGFGLDSTIGQQQTIAGRFYTRYPDEFDELIVFLTFDDSAAMGASAYEISAQQNVKGLGRQTFDQSSLWGATGGKLFAFVNMNKWDNWGGFGVSVSDPQSPLYPVLGQEFAHRWLSFLSYVDGSGAVSAAMLGRDKSHWASTLEADASVMDGNRIVDNGDGTFTIAESFSRYSPLDLYAMGLEPANAVPPFFRVADAKHADGTVIDPTRYLRRGSKITGTREDITIDQVVAASGARVPSFDTAPHEFRVAFVLVTRPGERAGDVAGVAAELDRARVTWEGKFAELTSGRGTMCTQVSAPCGAPVARIVGGRAVEAGGNHNGVIEPGEPVWISLSVENSSAADAQPVSVSVMGDLVGGRSDGQLDLLRAGASAEVPFAGVVPAGASCGVPVIVEGESAVGGNTFRGFVEITPGLTTFLGDDFETNPGHFVANSGGGDTATNGWAWGAPSEYGAGFGWVYQPGAGHSGKKCWFTGLGAGHKPYVDSALGLGSSTLTTRPLDVSATYHPAVSYWAWFEAVDFTDPKNPMVPTNTALTLDASDDGGKSWAPLDSVGGADPSWRLRTVALGGQMVSDCSKTPCATRPLSLAGTLTLRFTATNLAATTLIEAGVDDVVITTLTPACNPDAPAPPVGNAPRSSGGCAVAGGESAGSFALVLVLLALALARRRARV